MKDTFTRVQPLYPHKKGYAKTDTISHVLHKWDKNGMEGKPTTEVDRRFHLKRSVIRDAAEAMFSGKFCARKIYSKEQLAAM